MMVMMTRMISWWWEGDGYESDDKDDADDKHNGAKYADKNND